MLPELKQPVMLRAKPEASPDQPTVRVVRFFACAPLRLRMTCFRNTLLVHFTCTVGSLCPSPKLTLDTNESTVLKCSWSAECRTRRQCYANARSCCRQPPDSDARYAGPADHHPHSWLGQHHAGTGSRIPGTDHWRTKIRPEREGLCALASARPSWTWARPEPGTFPTTTSRCQEPPEICRSALQPSFPRTACPVLLYGAGIQGWGLVPAKTVPRL